MKHSLRENLEDVLIKGGLVKEADLETALSVQRENGGILSKILVGLGVITESDLMLAMSQQLDIPLLNLSRYTFDEEVTRIIPKGFAAYYQVIPISQTDGFLTVVTHDPLNVLALDDLKALTGREIIPVIAASEDIEEALRKCYEEDAGVEEIDEEMGVVEEEEKIDLKEAARESEKAPIIKMVDLILIEALKKRASDIHFEPYEDKLRVRYRIDGNLQKIYSFPKKIQNAITARFKIMSKMDITERQVPQDGRFRAKIGEKEIDYRVSCLPVSHGEKMVLRILDKSNLQIGLDKHGFLPGPLKCFQEAIARPYGMILVTGPTGSGKSTTLYSVLNQLNTPERNIITVEDPVEYQVNGITQIAVNSDIGLTFASGLKSILRQSPDVIMVGEIRDFETADIAVKAALIGQLVLSTLHTNDAPSAVVRLTDMGVEPFLIASSVIMIAAQRLCRRLCPGCREEYTPAPSILEEVGLRPGKDRKFYRAKGCKQCNNTGYRGRMGTLEVLVVDDKVRDLINRGASVDKIRDYACKIQGMKTLRENALEKFASGLTSLEEVFQIT